MSLKKLSLEQRRVEYPCGCVYAYGHPFGKDDPIGEEVVGFRLCKAHEGRPGSRSWAFRIGGEA